MWLLASCDWQEAHDSLNSQFGGYHVMGSLSQWVKLETTTLGGKLGKF